MIGGISIAPLLIGAAILLFLYMGLISRRKEKARQRMMVVAPKSTKKPNWISCSRGPLAGRAYFLGQKTVTIGRAPSNFIQIIDEGVSRVHCQISPMERGVKLVDMNSRNGVSVNGRPEREAVLLNRDEFRIGETVFVYHEFANFQSDAGLLGKHAGSDAQDTTRTASADELKKLVEDAVRTANGDLSLAAKQMGVDIEFLQTLLNRTVNRD